MAPEVESHDTRIARLEERQKAQEKDLGAVLKVAERAEEAAMEAKDAVVQVNQTLAAMPQKIITAIEKRGGARWDRVNLWLAVGAAIAAPFVSKWLGV